MQMQNMIQPSLPDYAVWLMMLCYQMYSGYLTPMTIHQSIKMDGSLDGLEKACEKENVKRVYEPQWQSTLTQESS